MIFFRIFYIIFAMAIEPEHNSIFPSQKLKEKRLADIKAEAMIADGMWKKAILDPLRLRFVELLIDRKNRLESSGIRLAYDIMYNQQLIMTEKLYDSRISPENE